MRSTLVFLLGVLVGCTSPTGGPSEIDPLLNGEEINGVRLSVAKDAYRHGENALIHLVNNSSSAVGYNSCTASRERWNGESWIRIEPLRVCTAALYTLQPGSRISFEEPVTSEWGTGRYRIVLRIYRLQQNDHFMTGTHPFDVTP